VSVGVVVAIALLVLAAAILGVGEQSQFFRNTTKYRVVFPTADGLRTGSPVRMAGVTVGSVFRIELPTDPEAQGIEVRLRIDSVYAERLRENTEAALRYLQLLSGEKYVDLTPGDPLLAQLDAGAVIPSKVQAELFAQLEQGADIAENARDITVSLKEILGPLERGEGLLGRIIHDPEFGTQAVDSLNKAFADLEVITAKIRRGEGFVGRLLFDEEVGKSLDDLANALESFSATMESLGKKEGALGAMTEEGGSGQQAIEEFRDAAAAIKRAAVKLEAEDGLLGKISDPEYAERVTEDLAALVSNLRQITDKINEGDGTVGALINSRVVYDGMEEIVAGVNDSGFARWLMRRYQKKGIKMEESSDERGNPEPAEPGP
jgi:phospholipid/cholesterol/gamma-HCH transport system substrate-binding protein